MWGSRVPIMSTGTFCGAQASFSSYECQTKRADNLDDLNDRQSYISDDSEKYNAHKILQN